MSSYKQIDKCRVCGNKNLRTVLNLGSMFLTGIFPLPGEMVESSPLELVKCFPENEENEICGLVQLRHTYDLNTLYGDTYGYRSGLNASMVKHLQGIVKEIEERVILKDNDLVVDIASNDGVLLGAYKNNNLQLVGIDPSVKKFGEFYKPQISKFAEFFSSGIIKKNFSQKAKIITSIAMFYDLEDPMKFVSEVKEVLAEDGIWVLEQSYLPLMISQNSYDTICHEHLEYYALRQINWIVNKNGLKIIDVSFNRANGGSFRVSVVHRNSEYNVDEQKTSSLLDKEKQDGFNEWKIYENFANESNKRREELVGFLQKLKNEGKTIFGYGASTKGNVVLQFCNLSPALLSYIAEVNSYKFGRTTPGTNIPIISEAEAKKMRPDYFLVLPWHFKDNIIERESEYLQSGGHLIFPLPKIEVV